MVFPFSSPFVIVAAPEAEPSAWILIPDPAEATAVVALVIKLFETLMSASVPLLLKSDPGMLPCPADVPWQAKFEAAMAPMKRAKWQETADLLSALAAEVPSVPQAGQVTGAGTRPWTGAARG